jgi:Asp-tRNA(Asn)/Glu-tRNA(Gln) amidotransferase A subunit family amidase
MPRLQMFIALFALALVIGCGEEIRHDQPLTIGGLRHAETVAGISFTAAERELMMDDLREQREAFAALRNLDIPNDVRPALVFQPWPAGWTPSSTGPAAQWSDVGDVRRPDALNDLAFASIGELSELLRTRRVTSTELTRMFLDRLRQYGPELECVINLTEARAMAQASAADLEIAAGRYKGPLHGVPYGVKDLLAVAEYPTTWGATPFKDQVIDETATVVRRLDAAGAVLCAKLTLGALAWGDVWFGGTTRNPWNLEQGSSGSSAGPASAVSAGLVPFAIGSETWGSIVSPATRCGVTGLRPTFGRVSRSGAMALSWTMDKLGPIARSAEECAMVFDAIRGPDGLDPTLVDVPFSYRPDVDWSTLRVGYVKRLFDAERDDKAIDDQALEMLRGLGAQLIPITLPERDAMPISLVLSVEAAAAFEELTLSGRDDKLVSQIRYAWPNVFRAAQMIPATAYVQANRARSLLIADMVQVFEEVDLYVVPSFGGQNLLINNLTGHPCVVAPNGFTGEAQPHSWTFVGDLFDEATICAVAEAWQQRSGWHGMHPPQYH